MKLFGLSITRSKPSTINSQPSTRSLTPEALAWLSGNAASDRPGYTLSSPYEQVSWVYRAVTAVAEHIANIPFLFSRGERGRENLITSGPLLDFYDQPHPQINRFQYWELRVLWLMLRGESFRIPIYSNDRPGSLSLSAFGGEGRGEVARSQTHSLSGSLTGSRGLQSVLILN